MYRTTPIFFLVVHMLFSSLWAAERPNIVLFVADDLGYAGLNSYGADDKFLKTPNLSKLASEGIQFNNACTTASVCSPTRYTMLTGRYSWRTHMKSGVVNLYDKLLISPDTMTVGKFLQQHGYRTASVGKWHLGYRGKRFKNLLGKVSPGPNDVGFDYHFGIPNNFDDLHKVYIENDRVFGLRSDAITSYGMSYYKKPYVGYDAPQRKCAEVMDLTTEKALMWLKEESRDKPFFLYFAAVSAHHPIIPSARMKGQSGEGPYGDFIQDIDHSVGQFMQYLEREGLAENTIFIFTSDNGGELPKPKEYIERQAYDKGFHFNGDHRGDKHQIYEGGLKVPFIVRWPKAIQAGAKSDSLITTGDIFGTVAEILTGKLPDPEVAAPDSVSFYNNLKDPAAASPRTFLVHRDALGRQAIRQGKWKFVDNYFPPKGKMKARVKGKKELYNLEEDHLEENNVINDFPEVAERMEALLEKARQTPSTRGMAQTAAVQVNEPAPKATAEVNVEAAPKAETEADVEAALKAETDVNVESVPTADAGTKP